MAKVLAKPDPEQEQDLASLHLHDRHTGLGLSDDDLVGLYRTILLARRLDQKIWGLNRMGKAAFVVSAQGHEGAQIGSAWAIRKGHDVVLPYYRDLGVAGVGKVGSNLVRHLIEERARVTVADVDPVAVERARQGFAQNRPSAVCETSESPSWDADEEEAT